MVDRETRISSHHALLKGLIQRSEGYEGFTPMHFNQAEIGSHFTWRRSGEYSDVVHCLNFLQATRKPKGHKGDSENTVETVDSSRLLVMARQDLTKS
jgi:hypothetical protein